MKRIIVWITVLSLILAGVFAMNACNRRTDENGATYELNTPARDELNRVIITYGEQPAEYLRRITITKTENGVSSTVPVEPSMLVTTIDTSAVDGNGQILQFSYSGQMFSVPVVVKYKVEFVVEGNTYRSYYVHNKAGLDNIKGLLEAEAKEASGLGDQFNPNKLKLHELLVAPAKDGYSFKGWSEGSLKITENFPSVIKENITFTAVYEPVEEELPALPVINAVYGDLLADIVLPSFENGKWQFKDSTGTVGNAGENTFAVQFIEAETNEVLEERSITILVAKKQVNFSGVVESFIYNGKVQLPTFQTDVPELGSESILFDGDDTLEYINVGSYSYSFTVVNENYEGTLKGTFEIKPAVIEVTVQLAKDLIYMGDDVPEVTYALSVPEGMNAAEFEQFISAVIPEVDNVGEYKVTATTSNKNIELVVTPATFTVEKRALNVGAPTLADKDSIRYGNQLADVQFDYSPYGTWEWANPTDYVGEAGTVTHLAVFTPNASHKYEQEYCWVEFTVNKVKVEIIITENVFDYDGQEHSLSYIVKDEAGNEYTTLTVLGNAFYTNAGVYEINLTLDERNYYIENGVLGTNIEIKKINPTTDADKNLVVTWKPGLTLGQIALPTAPNGYFVWGTAVYNVDSGKYENNADYANEARNAGYEVQSFNATFVPYDQVNYELDYTVVFQVIINKATPEIEGIESNYSFIYNGGIKELPGATVNTDKYGEDTAVFEYTYEDGTPFTGVTEAGVYTVIVTLCESANNASAQVTVTITVAKADPEKPTQLQSADYGDLAIDKIKLPLHEQGVWSLKDVDETTTVGTVGRHVFVAVFTPTTGNYNSIEVSITVDVAKKYINVPEISELYQNQVYTGALLNSGLTSTEGYIVIDNGGINVGTYTVQIVLDAESYEWNVFGTEATFELQYNIIRADNAWAVEPTINPEWTYGDTNGLSEDALAAYKGIASAVYGEVVVLYAPQGTEDFSEVFPINAGTYTVKFIVTDSNYNDLVKTIDFTIHKKTVNVPNYTATYLYTGSDITVDIPASDLYTIAGNVAKNAGTFEAVLTLVDSVNYKWNTSDADSITLAYEIITSGVALSVTINGWTYGEAANAPIVTIDKSFIDDVAYIVDYSEDGIAWSTVVPTDAGSYIVRVRVEGTANYESAEETCNFVIAKAAATIEGADDTYTKDYDGEEFELFGVTASNGAAIKTVITKNGAVVNAIVEAGEYVITYSVAENANYLAATRSVVVTVEKADVTISAPVIEGWTYGDAAKTPVAGFNEIFAQISNSEITFKYFTDAECTNEIETLVNTGTYYVKAIFAGNDNLNAAESEAVAFVIARLAVNVPTVSDKAYNGALQTSGLVDSVEYTVVDLGGINVGTYKAVVTLVSDNYVWADGTSAEKELAYEITPIANTEVFESVEYTATYGDLLKDIITLPAGVQGTWSIKDANAATTVGNAGVNTFKAIFTPDEVGNYVEREVTITITVAKATVNVPTEYTTEYVYTGSDITAVIPTTGLYTVTNNVAKNVGNYNATLTLTDSANYVWSNGDTRTTTVPYSITRANVTLSDLVLNGWTYGQAANVPTVTINKNFLGDVIVSYEYLVNGAWGATAPVAAGTYKVKAEVVGTSNYTGAEITAEFTIAKATVTINGAKDSYTKDYDGNAFTLTGITASNGATVTKVITNKAGETVSAITDVGEYVITYSVAESTNYLAATRSVVVTVEKADVTISAPVIEGWTYGDAAKAPSATFVETFAQISNSEITFKYFTDAECTNEIETLVNAGTYYVKAIFAGNDNLNAAESEAVAFVIARLAVNVPTVSNKAYNGALQTSGLVDSVEYTVVDLGGINVGTYKAVVTLVSDNYVWADGTSAEKELAYEITPIANTEVFESVEYTATYGDLLSDIITLPAGVQGTWSIKDANAATTVGNAGVNTFKAIFTPDEVGNYVEREVTITITVAKATVNVPTEYTTEYVYTGSDITAVIPTTGLYTVTNNVAKNVGNYNATLTLTDSANYVWSNGDTRTTTVPYSITRANVTLSDLVLNGWTYGQAANVPEVLVNKSFADDVTVYFEYSVDGAVWSKTVPTAAGTYQVRAIVDDTDNYFGTTSDAASFNIAKATASINGVNAGDVLTQVYNGNAYVFSSNIKASHNESALQFAIFYNGAIVDAIVNAGEYTVVITLPESDNYNKASVKFTVAIAKAENTDEVSTAQNATYGDAISGIVLPTSTIGTWKIKEAVTTVGNAGVNTFTALFTPNTENYNSREVTITVTVAKKVVDKPIIDPVEYTGEKLFSGLIDNELYTVVDNGGIDHGEYDVVLTLVDPNNYKWDTSDEATITVKFVISTAINKWVEAPSISSWEYESAGDHAGKATAMHGSVLVEYKPAGAPDSEYSTTLPTLPGDYVARFTTTDDNYIILSVTKNFSITKRRITPPTQTQTSFIYTGSVITSGLTDGIGYAVVADEGRTNVGSFTATVSLTSEYYVWTDGTSADKTFTYNITPATNTEDITLVYNAIYGDLIKDVITLPAGVQGTWSIEGATDATTVGNAGTRTFTVVFTPDEVGNYKAREVEVTVTVEKAPVTPPTVTKQEGVEYTANKVLSGVLSTELYTATDIGGVVVGTHKVQLTLTDKNNYKWQDGDSDDIYFDYVTIVKAQNRDEIPTYTATYGDSLATLALPTSATGSWKWQTITAVGNVGEENKHVLVFTPADAANFEGRTVEVSITVTPKKISVPAISEINLNQVYTGETLFSGLMNGEGYTVVDNGGINVGSYKAVVSLANANYIWADGTSAAVELTYNITPATNTEDITLNYTAIYGDLLKDIITLPAGVQGTWSIEGMTDATVVGNVGTRTFKAIFTPDETGNYNVREVEITVTVGKKAINAPTEYTKEYTYTGSDITAIIPTSDLYTIAGDVAKNVGSYSATLTLTDSANYKWATTEATTVTVPYSITKASATISNLTIVGWTYGNAANAPVVTIAKDFSDAVSYIVEYSEDGIAWTTTVPTDAGTYIVRVRVEDTDNYDGDEATCDLTIEKAAVTIGGVNDTYSKDYDGEAFIVPGATSSNNVVVKAVITKNGAAVDAIISTGEYVITYSVAESANYLAATKTVNVIVEKADVTISAPVIEGWTYGDAAKAPVAGFNEIFAQISNNEITFTYFTDAECANEIATPVNAGTYYVKAIFAGNDNLNAAESEATAFVIAKLAVNVPTVSDKVYNGEQQNGGVAQNAGYTVVDNGGINVGSYKAVVSLANANYIWVDGTSADVELIYNITPATNTEDITLGYTATYGDLLKDIVTLPAGVQGTWSIEGMTDATVVGNAGVNTFKAIFTPDETGNYNAREVVITVTVGKKAITAPTEYTKEYTYTGSNITADIPTSDLYTITGNVAKNVDNYNATLTLTDSANYKWETTDATTVTVSYSIIKASVTLKDLVLGDWTYGGTANVPTVTVEKDFADSITVTYEYLVNGEWAVTAPKNAGTYTVKAVVEGTANYNGDELTAEFTIAKASVTIGGVEDSYNKIYNGNAFVIPSATASNGANVTSAITKGDATVEAIIGVGTYTITYSFAGNENYSAAEKTVTVTVEAANVTISAPVIEGWTYGDAAKAPNATFVETFAQGDITFKYYTDAACTNEITNLEGIDAGTYYVKAFFAGNENLNAAESEATAFAIAKKVITAPTATDKVYNGEQQNGGIAANAGYTVVDNGGINVGPYTAVVTLTNANYVWDDGTTEAKELTYSITKASVSFKDLAIAGWVSGQYDATANMPTVTVVKSIADDVTVTFEYYVDGVWGTTVPTRAGTYAVRAVATGTNNYDVVANAGINFNVAKAEVALPTIEAEYPYTGSAQRPEIADSIYYTVVGNDAHIAMGEYTITLVPKAEFSFVWAGETDEPTEKVLTYKIGKGKVTLSGLTINNWSYKGEASTPTVTVTTTFGGDVAVRYEYYTADGTLLETVPTAVGSYKIKAIVDGSENYDGTEAEKAFEITKASATWDAPTFTGGVNNKFYMNQFGYSTSGLTATYAGETIPGTFTFGAPVFVEGENASYIELIFTPDADYVANYATVKETYYVTFVTVATNTTKKVSYGSIEAALAAAVAGDTVQVKPYDIDLGAIYIMSDVEIKSGVTLILPYGIDGSGVNTINQSNGQIDVPSATESSTADPAGEELCHVKVVLAAGKKITNNGTLQIAGQLSGGAGASKYAGFTAGEHARLILDAGAELVNNGTIYAAGFIRELNKDNGSKVTLNNGSILYQPFTVRDFPGGSVSYALYGTMGGKEPITAFSRFILMNVSPEMRINYGSEVRTWALLYAGSQINQTVGNIIGYGATNTTSVIALTDENYSYMIAKFDVDTEVCDLDIYGGAKTNGMKLTVKALLSSISINTEDALFAVSYHYDVSLNKSEGQETATFTMGQRFKIMTGAKFTVGEGVILNATDIIVYETFNDIRSDAANSANVRYPDMPAAIFTVNGTLNVNNFGGKIYTEVVGAIVNIKTKASYTAYELKSSSGSTLTATVDSKNPITEDATFAGITNEINATIGVNWTSTKVVLNPDNGEAAYEAYFFYNPASPTYPALPDVTKDGSAFQGWYNGETLVQAGDAMSTEPHTLTAKWISGITVTLDANGGTVTNGSLNITSDQAQVYPTLETPTRAGYNFTGWYYNGEKVEAGQEFKTNANHTLVAGWEAKSYTVTKVTTSNATVSGVTQGQTIQAGTEVTVTVSFSQNSDYSFVVKDASGNKLVDAAAAGTYTFTMPGSDITVEASSAKKSDICIVEGTLITLADGTQKKVEDLTHEDLLLIFNHETGKMEAGYVAMLDHLDMERMWTNVINLVFSNGETLRAVWNHGVFDVTLNEYVIVSEDNYADFVGHQFYSTYYNGSEFVSELVTMTDAFITYEYIKVYNPTSYWHMNYFANGILNVTAAPADHVGGHINIFALDEDMKYDVEQMQEDIEEYGLYTYEDFAEYLTEEQFYALPFAYLKVAVGKGNIDWESIMQIVEYIKAGSLLD